MEEWIPEVEDMPAERPAWRTFCMVVMTVRLRYEGGVIRRICVE